MSDIAEGIYIAIIKVKTIPFIDVISKDLYIIYTLFS